MQKFLKAARKRGINATAADAKEVQGSTKQLFAPPPAAKGAHATNEKDAIFQADLASLVQYSSKNNKGNSYFLLVVEVFTREIRTAPLESKKPQEVWEAFADIIDGWKTCQILWTDDGIEFGNHFVEEARKKGIVVQHKDPENINGIAVADAAMKSVKERMFASMAEDNTSSWYQYLAAATTGYNKTPPGTLYDEAPEDVDDSALT